MSEELLYNEVLGITNDFVYPSNSEIYEKEPQYNEFSLWGRNFCHICYIEVPLYESHHTYFCGRAGEIAHHLHSFRFLSENCGEF